MLANAELLLLWVGELLFTSDFDSSGAKGLNSGSCFCGLMCFFGNDGNLEGSGFSFLGSGFSTCLIILGAC